MWQYGVHDDVGQGVNSCYIHDPALGAARPVCTKRPPHKPPAGCVAPRCYTTMHGESRTAAPPPLQRRSGVSFKEPAFDDSSWETVDAPHDFIMRGTYVQTMRSFAVPC